MIASRASVRGPAVVSVVALALTLAVIPIAGRQYGPTTSFVPAILAAVACFDIISVWLLAGDYLDTGRRRILMMALAYLWSLLLMGGYALAFPGVLPDPPLAAAPSVAPYLYIGWHAGFPIILGLAWAPWPMGDLDLGLRRRGVVLFVSVIVTSLAAVAGVLGCVWWIEELPVLIVGLDTAGMVRVTAPIVLPLVVASLVTCGRGLRGRTGPERWAFVAVFVCLCDLCLTYLSRYRFSLGWYAGRTLTVAAAVIVLVAMLASFRRLKATAEFNAAYDDLTGLPNRRSAYDALTALVARGVRMHTPLAVMTFDLDHFKAINDTHGHAVGDEVLRAVGAAVRASVRTSDVAARIGGEEFLLMLPDATEEAAQLVAGRVRDSLARVEVDIGVGPVTASFGLAVMQSQDSTADALLLRADAAMYAAKKLGRDQVCVAPPARVRTAS